MEGDTLAWTQWLALVEIPAFLGLFWYVIRLQVTINDRFVEAHRAIAAVSLSVADYKLEVAKTYASIGYLKDVEQRLVDHLLRIEGKLDVRPSIKRSPSLPDRQ